MEKGGTKKNIMYNVHIRKQLVKTKLATDNNNNNRKQNRAKHRSALNIGLSLAWG